MRLVVVDVGNTSTAVGLWSDGRVSHVAHCDGGFDEASRVVKSLVQTLGACDSVEKLAKSSARRVTLRGNIRREDLPDCKDWKELDGAGRHGQFPLQRQHQ